MTEKKTSLNTELENTMACGAFAEAGEPCPINIKEGASVAAASTAKKKTTAALESVENTMACSAFAEAGEPCPIDTEEKSK
jgi:hypothetical protein